MDSTKTIKLPRSRTAAMQLMQQLTAFGHYLHVSGVIARRKLPRYLAKLSQYPIYRDAPGRAYDRKRGFASVHLVVVALDQETAFWCLLSTKGRRGLEDPDAPKLGTVHDGHLRGQHLQFLHYELLYQEKRIEKVSGSTWTWRVNPRRYLELEAAVVQTARERNKSALATLVVRQSSMPLFSGVRGQVLKLNALAGKLCRKFKHEELELPQLPYMIRRPLYDSPPITLWSWVEIFSETNE